MCWGSDAHLSRYLGNGPFKDVAVGASELCVLSAHGEAVCVEGLSSFGLESAPAGRFESITLGLSGNACALNEIGAVACWGNDRYGQADVPRAEFQDVDAALSGFVCGRDRDREGAVLGEMHNLEISSGGPTTTFRSAREARTPVH